MKLLLAAFVALLLLVAVLVSVQTWRDAELYCSKLGGTYFGPGQCFVTREGWNAANGPEGPLASARTLEGRLVP